MLAEVVKVERVVKVIKAVKVERVVYSYEGCLNACKLIVPRFVKVLNLI